MCKCEPPYRKSPAYERVPKFLTLMFVSQGLHVRFQAKWVSVCVFRAAGCEGEHGGECGCDCPKRSPAA